MYSCLIPNTLIQPIGIFLSTFMHRQHIDSYPKSSSQHLRVLTHKESRLLEPALFMTLLKLQPKQTAADFLKTRSEFLTTELISENSLTSMYASCIITIKKTDYCYLCSVFFAI